MGCKAGYPENPCPFKFDGVCNRKNCAPCKNFIPPVHILTWCMLYDREGVVCQLPKSSCETCPEKAERMRGPNAVDAKVDWKDPESVRKYWREQAAKHPEARAEAMLRFLDKNPDYFAKYREANRQKMREANRRYYQKKKGKDEQGS